MFIPGDRVELKLTFQGHHLTGRLSIQPSNRAQFPVSRLLTACTRDGFDELWESLDALLSLWDASETVDGPQLF